MTSIPTTRLNYSLVAVSSLRRSSHVLKPPMHQPSRLDSPRPIRVRRRPSWRFCVRASNDRSVSDSSDGARTLKGMIEALPPAVLTVQRNISSKFAVGIYIAFALFAVAARQIMLKKHSQKRHGSVADLVRRGQLRPDRRGISPPLKYEDPFNNPLVKASESDSTIEMCGKVYRLAPITLTEKQQSEHQKRRSRAYQWKKPKVFLKEGDSVPPDVEPDAVRWVPVNHPFATTVSDIDEKMAQDNVSQKHGVPSRIKAEHEALQKKLEALQNGELNINRGSIQDPKSTVESSSNPHEQVEPSSSTDPSRHCHDVSPNPNEEVGSRATE